MRVEEEQAVCEQIELFDDWTLEQTKFSPTSNTFTFKPRDREAAQSALMKLRARYGGSSVQRAVIVDHYLPERDHFWSRIDKDCQLFTRKVQSNPHSKSLPNSLRIRRILSFPRKIRRSRNWERSYGPFFYSGEWWSQEYKREYRFLPTGRKDSLVISRNR